jgi:UDP-2,3-diacylglucosamine pyrophosphatase LpxH
VDKAIFIISDCHLSAGRHFEGRLNPHEDFHFDDEMVDLFEHFSKGPYADIPVELIIAGDFLDPLNVPYEGEFEDAITEDIALTKVEAIIKGHPRVMAALKRFAGLPKKSIKYLIGNHDADLFFPRIRERLTREWDPEGRYPSPVVEVIADRDRITYPEGVEVHHGNQLESGSILNFEKPLLTDYLDQPVLNLPWSSIYVLKIINRLRWEREYVDKIRPVKVFVLFGMILDPWFTAKFVFLSVFYFLKTRFIWSPKRRARLKVTLDIMKQETKIFLDLEAEARSLLDQRPEIQTVFFGHTHRPMNKIYPDGKQYINTGSWVKMVNLDWRGLGRPFQRTFGLVHIKDGKAQCELRQWIGAHGPHVIFDM